MADNTETIRNLYEAFARGDIPTVLEAFAHDVKWTEAEGFPYAGTYVGPERILQGVFGRLGADWEAWTAVPREFVAQGETVVALGDYGGKYKATGKSIKVPFAHVWRLRDGKVAAFTQHTDTAVVQRALK